MKPTPGRAGYYLNSRFRSRLGDGGKNAEYDLAVTLDTSSRVVVIGARDQQLRFEVRLIANYTLQDRQTEETVARNEVEVLTSVDATASAYAAYAAERDRIQHAAEDVVDMIIRDIQLQLASADRET